jgi:hypothetical protein
VADADAGNVRLPIVPRFPEGVRNLKEPIIQHLSDSLLERRWIDAGPDGLDGQRIEFPGLELTIAEAVVSAKLLDGRSLVAIARPTQPWVEIEASGGMAGVVWPRRAELLPAYVVGSLAAFWLLQRISIL